MKFGHFKGYEPVNVIAETARRIVCVALHCPLMRTSCNFEHTFVLPVAGCFTDPLLVSSQRSQCFLFTTLAPGLLLV